MLYRRALCRLDLFGRTPVRLRVIRSLPGARSDPFGPADQAQSTAKHSQIIRRHRICHQLRCRCFYIESRFILDLKRVSVRLTNTIGTATLLYIESSPSAFVTSRRLGRTLDRCSWCVHRRRYSAKRHCFCSMLVFLQHCRSTTTAFTCIAYCRASRVQGQLYIAPVDDVMWKYRYVVLTLAAGDSTFVLAPCKWEDLSDCWTVAFHRHLLLFWLWDIPWVCPTRTFLPWTPMNAIDTQQTWHAFQPTAQDWGTSVMVLPFAQRLGVSEQSMGGSSKL